MGCCINRSVNKEDTEVDLLTPDENYEDFILEAMKRHNALRKLHGAPELVLNKNLNKHAQQHAEKMANYKSYIHSDCKEQGKRIGENLIMSFKPKISASEMTGIWYDEIKLHNFKNYNYQINSENFTQLIWKNTKEVGFGRAQGTKGEWYLVANYSPVGNIKGGFEQNVEQFKKD